MFNQARIKLTLWYLVIIFVISGVFSAVIYRMLSFEVDRFATAHRIRFESRNTGLVRKVPLVDEDLVIETKNRIFLSLIYINGIVLLGAGTLGYFLAGKTLQPIKDMVDEQHRFISDASHELRTPLTALKSSIEVNLRDKNLTLDEAKTLLKENLEDTDKLKKLTDSLLTLSSEKSKSLFEDLDLKNIVIEAIDNVEPTSRKKKIKIVHRIPDITLCANKQSLTELITILLDNAIKYSPSKSKISVKMKRGRSGVIISVADQGIGIEKQDQEKVFDRFFRAEKARSKGGHGLGLAIAKKIVTDHNGTIWVRSSEGKGSTFFVKIPPRIISKTSA